MPIPRRHYLRLCGIAGFGVIAGCADSPATDDTATATEGFTTDETTTPGNGPETDGTSTATAANEAWTQQATFTADDVSGGGGLGSSVAVSGDGTTAIVGAPLDGRSPRRTRTTTETPQDGNVGTTANPTGRNAGAAYVFELNDGTWRPRATLTADDAASGDRLGVSAAVSSDGTTALVGAERFEDPEGEEPGEAYVFELTDGTWSQRAKLTPDGGDSGDNFGRSVALSDDGTAALVGAYQDGETNSEDPGAAYVFARAGGSWNQQATLTAEDRDGGDDFGRSVAVSGDGTTALIGASLDEDPNGHFAGSAYVFAASGDSWSQQAKLTPDDGDSEDIFGWSVAVSGDGTTALVGAQTDEDPNGDSAGSAYVFGTSGGSWSQRAKLAANDGDRGGLFGRAVAVSSDGTTALVGAEDEGGMSSGAAYVFGGSGDSWRQRAKLTPDGDGVSRKFGSAVATSRDGTTALVGDPVYVNDPPGSAYMFTP